MMLTNNIDGSIKQKELQLICNLPDGRQALLKIFFLEIVLIDYNVQLMP